MQSRHDLSHRPDWIVDSNATRLQDRVHSQLNNQDSLSRNEGALTGVKTHLSSKRVQDNRDVDRLLQQGVSALAGPVSGSALPHLDGAPLPTERPLLRRDSDTELDNCRSNGWDDHQVFDVEHMPMSA